MLFIPFSGAAPTTKHALLLFVGSDTPSWTEIEERFEDWANCNVIPPHLIVLANVRSAKLLKKSIEEAAGGTSPIDVISRLCKVWLFSYTANGHVSHVAEENRLQVDGMKDIVIPAVKSFIKNELDSGSVVAAAPEGFYFSKLSNRNSSHFIRAENLLSCTASIELLAVGLLDSFRKYCDSLPEVKVRILVDSMVMWPLASALIAMRKEVDAQRRYVIESFRSYEGLSGNKLESGPAYVIISASTSGGLERALLEKLGPQYVECRTVLGLESKVSLSEAELKEQNDKLLYVLPRLLTGPSSLEGLRPRFETDVAEVPPGCETVRIIGERFLGQSFKPRPVRLAHRTLGDGRKSTLARISRERLPLVARRRPDGKTFWSVSFDISKLVDRYCLDDDKGECLLRSWLINYATAGDMAVVYPVDVLEKGRPGEGEAKRMAERAVELLQERSPGATVRVLDSQELDRPTEEMKSFFRTAGAVVVSPILGNGFVFKQISAALRVVQPKGPRLYIALAVLPESQARLSELQNDLKSNADESAYHFRSAMELPIGKLDHDIDWYAESQVLNKAIQDCDEENIEVPESLRDRLQGFREGNGLSGGLAFMSSYSGSYLAMSPGFLLWRSVDELAGDDLSAGVLLTVAVFLEACRTGAIKETENSLISGLFQQTLIAPANFTRFNDPAIQAALLRAAYKSELNFASSPDMSRDMQRLILRLMQLYDSPAAAALPEFILALIMGRVALTKEHMDEVLQEAQNLPGWLRILAEQLEAVVR